MTTPPTSLPIRASGANNIYTSVSGSLGATIGKMPAGSLVVVTNFYGPVGGGISYSVPVLGAQGGNLAMAMTEVHAADLSGRTCGFQVAWAFVPANYANDATLAYGFSFTHGASNVSIDTQWIVLDGADPSIACVGGYLDSFSNGTGWSTPAVQAPFDGVELHVFCIHNEGTSTPASSFASGPFGAIEGDGNIPFLVSSSSVWGPHAAGPSKPQSQNISGTPNYNVPGVSVPSIQSAVLVMPMKRQESAGELIT